MKAILACILVTIGLISAPSSHASAYDEMFATVDYMAKKYGMGYIWVTEQPMAPGVYGVTNGSSIAFNSLYAEDPDSLNSWMSNDVQHGFHPGRNCSAEQIVAIHESAHVLDNITGYSARAEVHAVYDERADVLYGQLSGYSFNGSSLNIPEALADAVVAVECDTPTPAERALYDMLTT